jgi:hypothetical protein
VTDQHGSYEDLMVESITMVEVHVEKIDNMEK